MKKIMVLVMVIAMILTFVGCSKVEEVTTTSSTLLGYDFEWLYETQAKCQDFIDSIVFVEIDDTLYEIIYSDPDENGDKGFIIYEEETGKELCYGIEASNGEIKAVYEWE